MIPVNVYISPHVQDMPAPAVKLWLWLITLGGDSYTGTPSGLHEAATKGGVKISRRSLPTALDWLKSHGMVGVERKGSYLKVDAAKPEVAA